MIFLSPWTYFNYSQEVDSHSLVEQWNIYTSYLLRRVHHCGLTWSHLMQLTISQIRQANMVRLYLCVLMIALCILMIADLLADPSGQFTPDGNLSGKCQGGSDIHWPPHQTKPPKQYLATFHCCMPLMFCTSNSPHQPRSHYGMVLDTYLGH